MQKTNKYKLNLIEGGDNFSPEPLNANTQAVEDKLATVDAKADAAQAAANTAQSTADSAFKPGQLPYKTGVYYGNGSTDITVNVGFRPSFLIINAMMPAGSAGDAVLYRYSLVSTGAGMETCVTITDTGFIARSQKVYYPMLADSRTYSYIAFR